MSWLFDILQVFMVLGLGLSVIGELVLDVSPHVAVESFNRAGISIPSNQGVPKLSVCGIFQ